VLAVKCVDQAGLGRIAEAQVTAAELLQSSEILEADVVIVQRVAAAKKQTQLELTLLAGLAARRMASQESLQRLGGLYEAEGSLVRARETLEVAASAGAVTVPLLTSLARIAYQ
jgi:hypothetical protein